MKKLFTLASFLLISVLMLTSCSAKTVKFSRFDGVFSPFFALTDPDISVVSMVHKTLAVTDEQDSIIYDAYTKGVGIADIKTDIDKNGDIKKYAIEYRMVYIPFDISEEEMKEILTYMIDL